MNNDPELDGKFIGTVTSDFVLVAETLKEASYQMRARKIDQYPIFPICKREIAIGKLLIAKEEMALKWNYYISMSDEFMQRKLIDSQNYDDFQQAYKDPDEFCCLFVVEPDFTNFLFVPYPDSEE